MSRRIREKLARRKIEPRHLDQAFRNLVVQPRRAKYGAYLIQGRDVGGRILLVVFHLRGAVAYIATAREAR